MSRSVTLIGYAVIAVGAVSLQLGALHSRRFPSAGEFVSRLMHRRLVRMLMITGWLWLGWHVFVRVHLD
jgi:Family of unknown function (DUF6186)